MFSGEENLFWLVLLNSRLRLGCKIFLPQIGNTQLLMSLDKASEAVLR